MIVFLLMCQMQAGELVHCTPPAAVTGHRYSQVVWRAEQPSWEACLAEAARRNGVKRVGYASDWRFFCYARDGE